MTVYFDPSTVGNRADSIYDADGHLEFDEGVARESVDADGGTDVASGFAEELDEEVGSTVDDGGGVGEAGSGVDVAIDGEDFGDVVEGAEFTFEDGELGEGAGAGGGIAFVDGAVEATGSGDGAVWAGGDNSG